MNIIEYLDSQVKKYGFNNYKILHLRFKSISNRLMTIYSSVYLQIYRYCKESNTIEKFEEERLNYPFFKYKLDSPCSKLYYDINTKQITSDEDVLDLYKDITIDRQMLKDLEDAMNKDMFQHIYMSTDLYINLHRFCEEMNLAFESTFDSLFENSIQSLKEAKIVIQAEGEVE